MFTFVSDKVINTHDSTSIIFFWWVIIDGHEIWKLIVALKIIIIIFFLKTKYLKIHNAYDFKIKTRQLIYIVTPPKGIKRFKK